MSGHHSWRSAADKRPRAILQIARILSFDAPFGWDLLPPAACAVNKSRRCSLWPAQEVPVFFEFGVATFRRIVGEVGDEEINVVGVVGAFEFGAAARADLVAAFLFCPGGFDLDAQKQRPAAAWRFRGFAFRGFEVKTAALLAAFPAGGGRNHVAAV